MWILLKKDGWEMAFIVAILGDTVLLIKNVIAIWRIYGRGCVLQIIIIPTTDYKFS